MGSASSRMSASPLTGSPSLNSHTGRDPTGRADLPADCPPGMRPFSFFHTSGGSRTPPLDDRPPSRATSARHMSVNSTIGVPLANVAIGEKEEGEISDGEGDIPARRDVFAAGAGPSDPRRGPGYAERYPSERPFARDRYRPSISSQRNVTPPVAGPSNYLPQQSYRPAGASRATPLSSGSDANPSSSDASSAMEDTSSLAVPADISPEDAQRYMDIIRKLLQGGYSPEMLVKKGATAKYVTAVCEDIVQGTKRRKELWLGSSSTPPEARDHLGNQPRNTPLASRSPSSEVEVLVSTERRGSMSSEGSAEYELIENPSPPARRPPRLVPSSHWEPPANVPRPSTSSVPPAQAIRIESYKPPQPIASSSNSSTPAISRAVAPTADYSTSTSASIQAQRLPNGDAHAFPEYSTGPSRIEGFSKAPPMGPKIKAKKGKKAKRSKDEIDSSGPATLNYEDDDSMAIDPPTSAASSSTPLPTSPLPPASLPPRPQIPAPSTLYSKATSSASWSSSAPPSMAPSAPLSQPPSRPFSASQLPIPAAVTGSTALLSLPPASITAQTEAQAEIDAKNAILEARRKVLESMKTRRKGQAIVGTSQGADASTDDTAMSTSTEAITAVEKSIEQEMLDLEQEVRDLQDAAEQVPMDIDQPEEGEITPSSLPAPLPIPAVPMLPTPPSLPTLRRGIKRPNAEDLDSRPTSALSRPRRKPFGGPPMKLSRLMINLDDHSDSDSEDESSGSAPVAAIDMIMRQKELQIQLLKDKIAKRMKEKAAKKLQRESASPAPSAPEPAVLTTPKAASSEAVPADPIVTEGEASNDFIANEVDRISVIRGGAPKTGASDNDVEPMDSLQSEIAVRSGDARPTEQAPVQAPFPSGDAPSAATPAAQPNFREYRSVMRRYPQLSAETLSSHSFPQFGLKLPTIKPLASVFTSLDRQLLSSIILTNRLAENPHGMICPSEAGGGVCADPTCDALHLCKGDPQEADWTEYILQAITTSTGRAEVDREKVTRVVHQFMRKEVKGKGKATESGQGQVNANMLASESALSGFLAKLGEAFVAQEGSVATGVVTMRAGA